MKQLPKEDDLERVRVAPEHDGERADRVLATMLSTTRSQVQQWFERAAVTIDERPISASKRVKTSQELIVNRRLLPSLETTLTAESWPKDLQVIDSGSHYAVLDKPAGLAVHPGSGRREGTLAHALLGRWPGIADAGHPQRPGIVHRLDIGTTGVMVVALTGTGYQALSKDFAERRVSKLYAALVYGSLEEPLEIELPIARHPRDRRRMAVRADGRPARSTAFPIARVGHKGPTLVGVELHTGRTHQIRVHLKAAKHPLVGDPVYGETRWKELEPALRVPLAAFPRPALHAWSLSFRPPGVAPGGPPLRFEAPPPADLRMLWTELAPELPPLEELLSSDAAAERLQLLDKSS